MEVVKKMDRVILHCDLNGFYASGEFADEETRKPMVGGDAKARISRQNEAAKIRHCNGGTLYQVRKMSDLLVLPPIMHLCALQSNKPFMCVTALCGKSD